MMRNKRNQLLWLGIAFLCLPMMTAVAEGRSIWERRTDLSQKLLTSDNPWNIQVSSKDGFIIEYSAPKLSPVVIHIQDAHANPPAQTKISLIIRALAEKHRVKLVCVEGADGGFDSALFNIEKAETKEKTARFFLGQARLTGAEYEWILHSKPGQSFSSDFTLWGIEDQDVYNEHWNVWEKTQKNEKETTELATQILKRIHADYGKYSSQELLRYEQTAEAFRQGVSGLKEYLQEVSKVLQSHPVDMSRYPETEKLLGILSGNQPGAIMAGLTSSGELDHLEQDIRLALGKSPAEKEYIQWSRLAGLFVRFVQLEMTPAEWKEFLPARPMWEEFVRNNLKVTLPDLTAYQQFYELAEKRDRVLYDNAFSKMRELQVNRFILITGGFHSYGMTEHMRQEKVPYLIITPRVDVPTDPAVYAKAMYGKPLTEEEIQQVISQVQ